MTQSLYTKTIEKVKNSVHENWGSPFIAVFMLLLVSTAIFLSTGLSYLADSTATFAFFALVVGVILQLVSFFKFRKKVSEASDV
jgi:amino acid transporter